MGNAQQSIQTLLVDITNHMKLEEGIQFAAVLFVLVFIIGGAIWWIPQKWQACGKLYDNLPAKIICLNSDS